MSQTPIFSGNIEDNNYFGENMKTCTKCKQEYPANITHFYRSLTTYKELDVMCRDCREQEQKQPKLKVCPHCKHQYGPNTGNGPKAIICSHCGVGYQPRTGVVLYGKAFARKHGIKI